MKVIVSSFDEIEGVIKVTDRSQIEIGKVRLFYELGNKIDNHLPLENNWLRSGIFKEIKDVEDMLDKDERFLNIEYLLHHNFVIKKIN